MLQRDASQLERILAQAGLKLDSGSLNFGLQGQAHDGDGTGEQGSTGAESGHSDAAGEDPLQAYRTVRGELDAYGHGLAEKPELVVLSSNPVNPADPQSDLNVDFSCKLKMFGNFFFEYIVFYKKLLNV